MATYVPNASDFTQPTEDKTVESAALEFRTIKLVLADITTVAGALANIATVADDLNEPVSEIDTVAVNIANVNTVGANIANVNTVAGNSANINTAAGNAAAINTVAGINTQVSTVAANVVDVTNFSDVYIGPKVADPATRNDATALQAGDLYFNTTSDSMMVYSGTAWQPTAVSTAGLVNTGTNQTISGTKTFSNTIVGSINGNAATATAAGSATTASAAPWSGITGKPTTVSGYGISDAITTANIGTQSVSYAATAGSANNALGVSQTWQDVTASRAYGTTYTNSTGKPIQVCIRGTLGAGNNVFGITVGGVMSSEMGGNGSYEANLKVSAIVPVGATYFAALSIGSSTLIRWTELR